MVSKRSSTLIAVATLLLVGACSDASDVNQPTPTPGGAGSIATGGGGGSAVGGAGALAGADNTSSGGSLPSAAGNHGLAGGTAQSGAGGAGSMPTRPINVVPGPNFSSNFNGQPMFVNKTKPALGKLVLLLGGICTGTGAGGFESFVKQYGFHVFAPKTQTCVNGAPDQYKNTIKTMPDDQEANRQVADARTELWDGKDRVNWVTVNKGESIVEETVAMIHEGMLIDTGGDWGYFLDPDGSLRTSDVYVVGYSWGSQSWAMISSYVSFGRVIITSGPVSEGFPNGEWMTHPSPNGTPGDRKYMLADLKTPYPSQGDGNMEKYNNVMKAGWPGMVTSVTPNGMGTYTADQHLFAMIGSNGASPGGHTVFCNDNPMNGWLPVCRHVLGVDP